MQTVESQSSSQEDWQQRIELDPLIPQHFEMLIRTVDQVHGQADHHKQCGQIMIGRLYQGLQNPSLTPNKVRNVIDHLNKYCEELPLTVEAAHFLVKFNTKGKEAINEKFAQATAEILDAHYTNFEQRFGKAPLKTTSFRGKQIVEIRSLNKVHGYTSRKGPMVLNVQDLVQAHSRQWVTAHQLFHHIQFAYGYGKPNHDMPEWFIEGSANWAASYVTNGLTNGNWSDFEDHEQQSVFTEGSDAFPLWVFLHGFQSKEKDQSSCEWQIKAFLQHYEVHGNSMEALVHVLKSAAKGQLMRASIPALIARYTTAKALNDWRKQGSGYERKECMRYMNNLRDYRTGLPCSPTPIAITDTDDDIVAGIPSSFGPIQLKAGGSHLYKLTFPAGKFQGKWARLTLHQPVGQPAIVATMLSAHDLEGQEPGAMLKLTEKQVIGQATMRLSHAETNSLYISVVDGRLGNSTEGELTYELEVVIS